MSAFMDSGHFWWQQCQQCRQAWFVGDKPDDVDADVTCPHCETGGVRASAARDAALEEAKADLIKRAEAAEEFGHTKTGEVWRNAASAVGALKSSPAERYVPEERVRDVLTDLGHGTGNDGHEQYDTACRDLAREALRRLGVDIDAKAAHDYSACPEWCRRPCGHPGAHSIYSIGTDPERVAASKAKCDTRQTCTCVGTCRGPGRLGPRWRCALEKGGTP